MLPSCGYQSIYLNNDKFDLPIKEFKLTGDKNINRKVISILNLKTDDNNNYNYILKLDSEKLLEITAKDNTGNATVLKTSIKVEIQLNKDSELIGKKTFNESFAYSNSEDKFSLSQYQKSIETNLIDKITEEIIFFLNNNV